LVAQRLRGQPADVDHVAHALSAFDLLALKDRAARTLSAGQRRRVALARVVAAKAPLWLLDEPLNALDAPAQKALNEGLARHLAEGGLAIAATHAPLDSARILELGA
jgi:heme exporter protein A